MQIVSWTSLVVAIALFVITAYLTPALSRRFKFVGMRYRIVVISGAVFMLCSIIELLRVTFLGHRNGTIVFWLEVLDVIQSIAIVVLAGASIGYLDIAFTNRKRTKVE